MTPITVFVVAVLFAAASASPFKDEWEAFKQQHGKNYANEQEENLRRNIFNENQKKVIAHNERHAAGEVSFKLGLNKYSDMSIEEVRRTMNGYRQPQKLSQRADDEFTGATFIPAAHVEYPKHVDWRKNGSVTPVKDQGQCGSCWSFSATGALEGQHQRKTGKLVSLSEQNLVDCSHDNYGCDGGLPYLAFQYVKQNRGIDTEKSYPYEGIDDSCRFKRSHVGAKDRGFVDIAEGDEKQLMKAVATVGPISVAIDASHESFQQYSGGIYNEPNCSTDELDHAVLVVGYGREKGHDYWLVKNSWGTSWGDNGYIKMSRNKENQCGIATTATYPLV